MGVRGIGYGLSSQSLRGGWFHFVLAAVWHKALPKPTTGRGVVVVLVVVVVVVAVVDVVVVGGGGGGGGSGVAVVVVGIVVGAEPLTSGVPEDDALLFPGINRGLY